MARIRLRGWFAIRLESIFTVAGNSPVSCSMAFLDGKATQEGRSLIHLPQKCYERNTESAGKGAFRTFEAFDHRVGWLRSKSGRNQWDLCLPEKSWLVKFPACASSRERMSITGFVHSRLCGTLADAESWAFTLRVLIIHPPKETKTAIEGYSQRPGARLLLELTMQGRSLHALLREAFFGPLYYSNKAAPLRNACNQVAPTPLSEQ
jgi:hypothetical protein